MYIAASLTLLTPIALAAQQPGTLTGHVTDASTGRPLADVQVRVSGTMLGTSTSEDGEYRIPAVQAGPHTVSVRRVGYAGTDRDVTITTGQTSTLDFALTAVAATLSQVVV